MIPVFVEAALRSLVFGLAVAVGLRVFRISNVLAQKAAWGLVLVSALAMPLMLPMTAQWHLLPARVNVVLPAYPMTLLEELQARIEARIRPDSKFAPQTAPILQRGSARSQEPSVSEQATALRTGETPSRAARMTRAAAPERDATHLPHDSASSSAQSISSSVSSIQETQLPAPVKRIAISPIVIALALYCGVTALFLVRLALGLFTTIRLWRTAIPIPASQLPYDAASLQLRASSKVASPLTIGSAILLPTDSTTWGQREVPHRSCPRTLTHPPGGLLPASARRPLCCTRLVQPAWLVAEA